MTLEDIADVFQLTRERVRQIEVKARAKARRMGVDLDAMASDLGHGLNTRSRRRIPTSTLAPPSAPLAPTDAGRPASSADGDGPLSDEDIVHSPPRTFSSASLGRTPGLLSSVMVPLHLGWAGGEKDDEDSEEEDLDEEDEDGGEVEDGGQEDDEDEDD